MTTIAELLMGQLTLQRSMAEARGQTGDSNDPQLFTGDRLADFMIWNGYALTEEIHEATGEFQWKPWVTDKSRGMMKDRAAFVGEMVDAFHFFMNMLLAASPHLEPAEIAEEFAAAYWVKRQTNIDRQRVGYDASKDEHGRELDQQGTVNPDLETMRESAERSAQLLKERNEKMR